MKRKLWIVGTSVIALIALCIVALVVFVPFLNSTQTEPSEARSYLFNDTNDIYDINEYYNYIATANVPENFITFEMLSHLGDFSDYHDEPSANIKGYKYDILDESGEEISIYVQHNPSNKLQTEEIFSLSDTDTSMMYLSGEETGVIMRNGIVYKYAMGRLSYVTWTTDNISFSIPPEPSWLDYSSLPTNSFAYCLLSVSETEFASALTLINAIPTKNDHVTE